MKRFGDIRTFFTNTSKSISTNNQNDPIENPENNPKGNSSLCLNNSENESNCINVNKQISRNPVIDLGTLESGPKQPILSFPLKKIRQTESFIFL